MVFEMIGEIIGIVLAIGAILTVGWVLVSWVKFAIWLIRGKQK